jgi:hypothetical protein
LYGLQSCRGKSEGVAKQPRELIAHPNPQQSDSQLFASLYVRGPLCGLFSRHSSHPAEGIRPTTQPRLRRTRHDCCPPIFINITLRTGGLKSTSPKLRMNHTFVLGHTHAPPSTGAEREERREQERLGLVGSQRGGGGEAPALSGATLGCATQSVPTVRRGSSPLIGS